MSRFDEPTDYEFWALDELDRVVGSARLQSPLGRPKKDNPTGRNTDPTRRGEYAQYFALPSKTRKRLAGGGYIVTHPYGLEADDLADTIIDRVPLPSSAGIDDGLSWYFRTAIQAMKETRRQALARRYRNRDRRAKEEGHDSYFYKRMFNNAMSDSDAPPAGNHPERRNKSTHSRGAPGTTPGTTPGTAPGTE